VLIHLCGVRGSTPAPGADFLRYGGHTSCVAIARDGEAPSLVLDAGTGIRNLSRILGDRPFRGVILLGHLHWDHTHGLPFFRSGDRPDSEVDVYLPAQGDDAEETLARGMSPPNFPIRPSQLRGDWRFHALEEGAHRIAGFDVLAREIPHKGGRTFGYRVAVGGVSLAYLSDHHPSSFGPGPHGFGPYHAAARDLVEGVDVLLHDAQYTAEEFPQRAAFGHSAIDYVLGLGETCNVGRVVLFHHDPARTDDELDAIAGQIGADGRHLVAAEMATIEVTAPLRSRPVA
jgi:phosphoribosyl 1,2-cyclic phosphodiesterase